MTSLVRISPFLCRMWALHDRLDEHVSEQSCRAEIESFSKYGQQVPALGRPISGEPDCEVELVYGARRLFVARHLNQPLTVELREMSDREAIVAMDIENRQRVDISPYERGLTFARWLRAGTFDSQEDLARSIGLSPSIVSRLLKVARLPAAVLSAFGDPTQIREAWAANLVDALADERRAATLQQARYITSLSPRLDAGQVYTKLVAASMKGRRPNPRSHDEVIKGNDGRPLFRVRHQRDSIAVLLPVGKVSSRALTAIRDAVAGILQPSVDRPSRDQKIDSLGTGAS